MKLFGIIGKRLDHSLSPRLFNSIFKKFNLPCRYLAFQVEKKHLKNLIICMKLVDVFGLNVTAPYKRAVLPFLDRLDSFAKICGAVNTIVRKKNRFVGYNTDGSGFLKALQKQTGIDPRNKKVTIVGAGGAARGIEAALAKAGAKRIRLVNRPGIQAKCRRLFADTDIVVQATPASPPLPLRVLPKRALVCDIVYHPRETKLLRQAKKLKLKTLDGLWMLIHQANLNSKLWTGKTVDPSWLRKIALGGK